MQNKCQVFTPDGIVGKLLDEIGYHKNLFGKKVYEILAVPVISLLKSLRGTSRTATKTVYLTTR